MGHRDTAITMDELRRRRDEILRVAAKRGAHNVRVFGSVARGESQVDSDIDFLVEFEEGRSVLDLSELILDLRELLGREVDVFTVRTPNESAYYMLEEAVRL